MKKDDPIGNFDLRLSKAKFDDIFGDLPVGSFLVDVGGADDYRYRATNRWLERHLDITGADIAGQAVETVPRERAAPQVLAAFNRCRAEKKRAGFEEDLLLPGGRCHLLVTLAPLTDAEGEVRQIVGIVIDLISRRRAEKALRDAERRYRRLHDTASEGIFQSTPDGWLINANPALARILGYDNPAHLIDELTDPATQLFVDPDRRQTFATLMRDKGQVVEFEYRARRRDGTIIWLSENAYAVHDDHDRVLYYEGTVSDITWRKDTEQRLQFLARHDSLTDLPNRVHFRDHFDVALAQSRRGGEAVALMMLDLDHFRSINETLGHGAGDELLEVVAERLCDCVRGGDIVSRLGGDEFGVIQSHLTAPNDAALLAQRMIDRIAQPITIEGHTIHTAVSIGITIRPDDHDDADHLLRHAGMALQRAKALGRGTFEFYSPEMRAQAENRMDLINGLRRALGNAEFAIHYQPKINATTGAIIGLEALLRWRHPDKGYILPGEFIAVAEETGLILPIGEWVFREVCGQLSEWRRTRALNLPVAINLSAAQFKDRGLVEKVVATLRWADVSPEMIELEITESVLMHDTEAAIETLRQLVELGLRISIDDFGTGYSSLSYLRQFPVAKLKIDQTFVNEVSSNPDDAVIARAIINLGHSLGIAVVAEGVETRQQLDFLNGHGCDEVQGFLYSRPLPADGMVDYARDHRSAFDA